MNNIQLFTKSGKTLLFFFFLFPFCAMTQTIRYVKITATGLNNGTSWQNAYTDLQDAINIATAGDEVWVAAGIYKPTQFPTEADSNDNRNKTFFIDKNLKIYGGFAGTETQLSERNHITNITTLSGDVLNNDTIISNDTILRIINNTDNTYHVLVSANLSSSAIIDGFTVKGGNANFYTRFSFSGQSFLNNSGGGICNISSIPILRNITFTNNSAIYGGAISNNEYSATKLTNIKFINNIATYGGAIYNSSSSPTLDNVIFTGNMIFPISSSSSPTAYGGAMCNYSSSPTLKNVIFRNNRTSLVATNYGGAIYNNESSPLLTNVEFAYNAASLGGAIYSANNSSPILINTTISGNSSGLYVSSGLTEVKNSIIWGNGAREVFQEGFNVIAFSHCIIKGSGGSSAWDSRYSIDRGNNLDISPLWVSTTNLNLRAGSPAINAGNNTSNSLLTDLAGNARVQGNKIDLGAYESIFLESCDTPNIPMVSNITATTAIVSWNGVTGGRTYRLEYKLTNDTTWIVATTIINHTFRLTGLSNLENYQVRVVTSCGAISAINSFTTSASNGVRYVKINATGKNNGTSWENAYTDLQDAINASVGDDEIWVAAGTYTPRQYPTNVIPTNNQEKSFFIYKNIKIYGGFAGTETNLAERNHNTNLTILSGDFNRDDITNSTDSTFSIRNNTENAYHVLKTKDITNPTIIDGFTIRGGNDLDGGGGGILSVSSQYTLKNIIFTYNSALEGGALAIMQSHILLTDVLFTRNKSNRNGGGFATIYQAGAVFTNVVFSNNSAPVGGAMSIGYNASIQIVNTIFTYNSAEKGGAIFIGDGRAGWGSPIRLEGVTFTKNSATSSGGAIYSNRGLFDLRNTTFANNSAQYGGSIYNTGSYRANSVTFVNNSATHGGALYDGVEQVSLTNVIFNNNSAEFGGAIIGSAIYTITECTFRQNLAKSAGGAIYYMGSANSTMTLKNTIFTNNSAASGGAITTNHVIYLENVAFRSNTATIKGGAVDNSENLTMINVLFVNNSAPLGGAMYNYSKGPSLTNVTFTNNSATSGGAMFNILGAKPLTRNSIIWNNGSNEIYTGRDPGGFNVYPQFYYSIIKGSGGSIRWNPSFGFDGGRNHDIDPLFISSNDARLQLGSPAIDLGNNEYNNIVMTDVVGNLRIYNGIIDLGAYESQGITNVATQNEMIKIKFYPNPTQDFLTIETPSVIHANIINLVGQVVKTIHLQEGKNQISVTDLAQGVYFLQANQQKIKFIKI